MWHFGMPSLCYLQPIVFPCDGGAPLQSEGSAAPQENWPFSSLGMNKPSERKGMWLCCLFCAILGG